MFHIKSNLSTLEFADREDLLKSYKKKLPLILIKRALELVIHPKRTVKYYFDKRELKKSGLFDPEYYLSQNSDLRLNTVNLIRHFLRIGYKEGRSPSPHFDLKYYLATYPDVAATALNPVLHYIRYGKKQGRSCTPKGGMVEDSFESTLHQFLQEDVDKNRRKYKSISTEDQKAILEIRESEFFDEKYYFQKYPEIQQNSIDAAVHYYLYGYQIGCEISAEYDFNRYCQVYTDVQKSNLNPLLHYLRIGKIEGRKVFLKKPVYPDSPEIDLHGIPSCQLRIQKYHRSRLKRNRSNLAVYSFNIVEDQWIFDIGINNDWDYICIVDDPAYVRPDSIWEYRTADYYNIEKDRSAFYYKCHPHIYLSEYQKTIWVDPNIVEGWFTYDSLLRFVSTDTPMGFFAAGASLPQSYNETDLTMLNNDVPPHMSFVDLDSRIWLRDSLKADVVSVGTTLWKLFSKHTELKDYFIDHCLVTQEVHYATFSYSREILFQNKFQTENVQYQDHEAINVQELLLPKRLDWEGIRDKVQNVSVKIVIPVFNALEDLKNCIRSIEEHSARQLTLVIADDCSDTDTRKWLENFARTRNNVVLNLNDVSVGYTKNVNRGIAAVPSDFTIILNSNTVVSPFWVEKLLHCAYSDENIGVVGPLSNAASWQTIPDLKKIHSLPGYYSVQNINEFLEEYSPDVYPKVDLVDGFCFGVKDEVFTHIGSFNEELFPKGYGEEYDFCLRVRQIGYLCAIATDCYVFHAESKSFGCDRLKLFSESRKILDSKYGKQHLQNIEESLRHHPILNYYQKLAEQLYKQSVQRLSEIGEPLLYLPVDKVLSGRKKEKIAVHLHLYHTDMASYFFKYLQNIPYSFDLYISVPDPGIAREVETTFKKLKLVGNFNIRAVANRGRNIAPLILTFGKELITYDISLHIHSKHSRHDTTAGRNWLDWMMHCLLYNDVYVANILSIMTRRNELGFISAPIMQEVYPHYTWRGNKHIARILVSRLAMEESILDENLSFPVGSFFWFKPKALARLLKSDLSRDDFPEEPIGMDGTLVHAIERSFYIVGKYDGFDFVTCEPLTTAKEGNLIIIKKMSERYINHKSVFAKIREAVEREKPFALIRYFDGEGAFYGIHQRTAAYAAERMRYYFGDFLYTPEDIASLSQEIVNSINSADIIGTVPPDILRNIQEFAMSEVGGEIDRLPFIKKRYSQAIDCEGAWRILQSYRLVQENSSDSSVYCSKDIHYQLVYSGMIYELLADLQEIYVITSQPVKDSLEQIFTLKVHELKIPQRAFDNEQDTFTAHYPAVYSNLLSKLSCDQHGKIYLVGGGPLGKVYCSKIKEHGGIAIDLGAVFDSWVNFHSRPEHRGSGDTADIDELLLLTRKNVVNYLDESRIAKLCQSTGQINYDKRINPKLIQLYNR
jgi:O-antigen biosynthesis protein